MEKFIPRTDLAEEKREERAKGKEIWQEKEEIRIKKTVVSREEKGLLRGKYITIYFPLPFNEKQEKIIEREIAKSLVEMIPKEAEKITVAGIGNHSITADSLGPETAENIIATRGIEGIKRQVSVIRPEVEAKTGIETAEFIKSITEKIKSDAVILIDSLASRSIERLFKTIQITNTGISPGSGLGLRSARISEEELGVPVIAIGVPTVVDINTLIFELTGKKEKKDLVVTPTNADFFVLKISEIISRGINLFNFGEL